MRQHTSLALGIALLFAGAALAADTKDEAIKKDRKQFEGTWHVVALEIDGNKLGEETLQKITVINEANGNVSIEVDGKVIGRGTTQIDPTKKPRTVDITMTEGDNKGKTYLGIYELGRDTRKVCYAPPDRDRPTEFSSAAGSGHYLFVLERVKK
jgi:uncharacterized protein (TIGR03067 family)